MFQGLAAGETTHFPQCHYSDTTLSCPSLNYRVTAVVRQPQIHGPPIPKHIVTYCGWEIKQCFAPPILFGNIHFS